jgi:hypothetical protein
MRNLEETIRMHHEMADETAKAWLARCIREGYMGESHAYWHPAGPDHNGGLMVLPEYQTPESLGLAGWDLLSPEPVGAGWTVERLRAALLDWSGRLPILRRAG